jgi:phage-related minor tail protein
MFTEIGHYAGGNARVINTLLRALVSIAKISATLGKIEHQDVLYRISSKLATHALTEVSDQHDRTRIQELLDEIEQTLRSTETLSSSR